MGRKSVRLLLMLSAILTGWSPVRGASYLNRIWQTGDGLPSNSVNGVVRDREGFLWLATGNGVARFDGLRFELHSIVDGLPDTMIHSLHLDRSGRIWVGTRRGAAYRENGKWLIPQGIPNEQIYSLGEAQDGSIWLGTYTECWRWSQGKATRVDLGDIPADTRSFLDDGYGGLWILTRGHLCRWSPDQPGVARVVPGPWSGYDLRDLCRDAQGRMIVCGTGLLLRESEDGWENLGDSMPGGPGANLVCTTGPDGVLWIATRDRGVMLLDHGKWSTIDSTTQLSLDDVRSLLIDDEGLVWLGTNGGGLDLLRRRMFESYAAKEGLGRTVTSALVIDRAGTVWVGTDGGGIFRHRDDRFVPAFPSLALPGKGLIWSLCATGDGTLWAGTYREGLLKIRGDTLESIALPAAAADKEVSALHEMHDGTLLAGVQGTGVLRWADGKFDPAFEGPSAHELPFHDVLEDRKGQVWAACGSHGLWRRVGNVWNRAGEGDGKDVLNAVALLEGRAGELWIGTLGQGLVRYQDGQQVRWGMEKGLLSDSIVQIQEDERRNLWLGSAAGLQRVSRDELESGTRLTGIRLGREDGLPTPQFSGEHGNLCAKASDGTLWFSLASGAIHLDPKNFTTSPRAPSVRIESAATDHGTVWDRSVSSAGDGIVVAPGSGTLRIRFTSAEFVAPERVRFRCRMDGVEEGWQEIEGARTVSYASLPPGNYRFDLMVAGRDGSWGPKAATIQVRQEPYFWQRLGFQLAAMVATVTSLVFVVYKWSRRRLRRKVEALRQERRVEMERARIARDLHDDLGASLTEINFLGTLAGGAMQEGPPRDKVLGMVERARHMAKSLDEIVWTVNPHNDTLSSTVHYLCSRVRESLTAAGIRCRLEVDEDLPECTLDSQQRHHLLMTVNEAVNNAMKHSRATEVGLTLRFTDNRLLVDIADNGKGFDPDTAAAAERNGLLNMQRRMESAGGTVQITPAATGTVVAVELPLSLTLPK
ncbi:histidine kinase [Luteolibacter arcticus]|uniref:Histidine kinase n=1 Tax=Luteolibacter arcticus TaxID=1581411 RepID=A0ABT3GEG9_9BACT|nr:sensor histidine kinase [Luteolibacter arcticus]MCW1922017.1 histidine kinase [Luteolibacter arcticus]